MDDASTRTRIPGTLAILSIVTIVAVPGLSALGADETPGPGHGIVDTGTDREAVSGLLRRYCFDCHAGEFSEANLRLDALDLSSGDPGDGEILQAVAEVVAGGRMPPEGFEGPAVDERELLASWVARRLAEVAEEARRSGNWTRNRRLIVEEYNLTMQDLFGVDAGFAASLPPDPVSPEGYRNDSGLLGLSPLQMECYLDIARQAVRRYVRVGTPDEPPVRYSIELGVTRRPLCRTLLPAKEL